MQLEAESKPDFQTELKNTSGVLGRVFLDPLFLLDKSCSIAIYEYCGLKESLIYESSFHEHGPQHSRLKRDLSFLNCLVGSIEVETDAAVSPPFLEKLSSTMLQLAPLLAWRQVSWKKKSEILAVFETLKNKYDHFNWLGLYRRNPTNENELIVGPYLGDPTPHEKIPLDKGICGAAIDQNKSLNIPDVNADSRYLSCSIVTKSELVVPIRNKDGEAIAEIDIDSTQLNAFGLGLQKEVETQAKHIESILNYEL